ncbi:putative flavin-containing monooxygenase 1 [Forsythia ovata]|uniref:Flavin-containing monooxygenase 1 n=1 Tax=Forsythia ovata TaxID=205694 RepID=A0ABD1TQ78_9LAMI
MSPMRQAASKIIETYLTWKHPLEKYGLKPDHPFEEDYASGRVEFDGGTRLDADVVVLATGFYGKKKVKTIIPEPFLSLLEFPSGMMPLYRGTINPLIPNMAFVGYIESVSNLHIAEIRCKWLS